MYFKWRLRQVFTVHVGPVLVCVVDYSSIRIVYWHNHSLLFLCKHSFTHACNWLKVTANVLVSVFGQ